MRYLKLLRPFVPLVLLIALWIPPLHAQTTPQTFRIESFQGQDVVAGEILVRFRDGIAIQAIAAQDNDIASTETIGRAGTVRIRSRARNVNALLQAYRNRLDVLYAEPNYVWHTSDIPNDAKFNLQWGLRNSGQTIQSNVGVSNADIRAIQAWDITEGSRNIVVGVVDTGVDYTHPDLVDNIWSAPSAFTVNIGGQAITCPAGSHGFNAIARTCDPMDGDGHGTQVAGVIAAKGNNGAGVSGVSRNSTILALKFLTAAGGLTSDAIAAMDFAIQVKALFPATANIRVLNNSWGGGFGSQALRDEIALTQTAEMLFVASAGNDSLTNDLIPEYPASFDLPHILSVASTDNADNLSSFSNWGTTKVHLGAPGTDILSTALSGQYAYASGTSLSAPMVSGAAALVLSACTLTTSQLRANLLGGVDTIPALAGKTTTGGRLNVFRSVSACATTTSPTFRVTVTPGIQSMDVNGASNMTVTVVPLSNFSGTVSLSVSGLPSGVTATLNPSSVVGGGSTTMTVTTGASVADGTYFVRVTGTSGPETFVSGFVLRVGVAVGLQQTINGSLLPSDQSSFHDAGRYADFYRLSITSTTNVVIDLKSRVFDTALYVLSPTGSTLFSSDNDGENGNSRISTTLLPGTYTLEVTSATVNALGNYSLSINTPTVTAVSPPVSAPGTATSVTLTGTRFASGMTIDAGTGVTVSNISVASTISATATFTVAASAPTTPHSVTVTTSEGTSNPGTFWIPPAITSGQRVSDALSVDDAGSPTEAHHFADLYRLTLSTSTAVTIDLRSTAFTALLRVLASTGSASNVNSGGGDHGNARITTTLAAGTYYVEAGSYATEARGQYTLQLNLPTLSTISPAFLVTNANQSVTFSGDRFSAPMTIDGGTGVTSTSIGVASSTTMDVNLSVANTATLGNHTITVASATGSSNPIGFRVYSSIPDLAAGSTLSATLSTSDLGSAQYTGSYGDLYRITLTSANVISVNVNSTAFNAALILFSSTGSVLTSTEDIDSSGNARLTAILSGGTYFLEVTSSNRGGTGSYTVSSGRPTFAITSAPFGVAGTSFDVESFGSPLSGATTFNLGTGMGASNVRNNAPYFPFAGAPLILGRVMATFSIAANATPGPRTISFSNSVGTSNSDTFTVYPSATPLARGQRISGSLNTGDVVSPVTIASYSDIYLVDVPSNSPVIIDLDTDDFDGYLYMIPAAYNAYGELYYPETTLITDGTIGGSRNARINWSSARYGSGPYYVIVTSTTSGIGNYSITYRGAPSVTSVSPGSAAPGKSIGVRLTGTGFFSQMVGVGDGQITVSNVTPLSQTSAIATVTVSPTATLGSHTFTLGAAYGDTTSTFTVTAPTASTLNFPRLFTSSDLGTTGFALMNPNAATANVTFTLYSGAGSVVATSTQSAPGRGQLSKLGSELFPGVSSAGWIRASSTAVGLQSFWTEGNFTTYMDASAAAAAAREIQFPLVTPLTELNIANAGSGANTVTIRVVGTAGTELATAVTQNIATNGIYQVNAATLFPSVNFSTTVATIKVTGTLDVTGTSVTSDFPVAPSWTIINGIDTALSLFDVYYPHVPSGPTNGGPAWQSTLGVTNLSTSSQIVTITFTPVSGSPTSVTRTIAGGGVLRDTIHNLMGFSPAYQEGWVKVSGTAALSGFVAYGYTGTGGATIVPAQGLTQSTLVFSHVANGPSWGTGLALVNPSSTPANVQVYVMRRTGALVGGADNVATAAFTLGANSKTAKLIDELVPAALFDDGFVFVRTSNNVPLIGMELFFSKDLQIIANVAPGAIDASITYTPPTN